jgi:hypothetical protein
MKQFSNDISAVEIGKVFASRVDHKLNERTKKKVSHDLLDDFFGKI